MWRVTEVGTEHLKIMYWTKTTDFQKLFLLISPEEVTFVPRPPWKQ